MSLDIQCTIKLVVIRVLIGANMDTRSKNNKSNHSSTIFIIVLLILTVPFLFNTLNFFVQKIRLEARKDELIRLINEENEKKQLYLEELNKVGTPEYYEYLARKYLGYIYPDEKVLIITVPDTQ